MIIIMMIIIIIVIISFVNIRLIMNMFITITIVNYVWSWRVVVPPATEFSHQLSYPTSRLKVSTFCKGGCSGNRV